MRLENVFSGARCERGIGLVFVVCYPQRTDEYCQVGKCVYVASGGKVIHYSVVDCIIIVVVVLVLDRCRPTVRPTGMQS